MSVINLCDKYRPKALKDIYGQDSVVSYFRSVINKPEEAPRYYYIEGGFGCGKTTLVRSFAFDLLGENFKNTPNYIEIDSSEKQIQDNFEVVKQLIFQEVPGWKVVLIDEAHLLPDSVIQQMLKVHEDYTGNLFIFYCSTETQLMFPPLLSRLHKFSLQLFTPEQCKEYGRRVLVQEATEIQNSAESTSEQLEMAQKLVNISDKALTLAALNSQGHLRTMVKNIELILFQGEEYFLQAFSSVWKSFDEYFFSNKPASEVVPTMYSFHPVSLASQFSYYFRDQILNPKAPKYNTIYPVNLLPKLFAKYLQLSADIKQPDDFYSFLYAYALILEVCKKNG